jgi:hypothetical protein
VDGISGIIAVQPIGRERTIDSARVMMHFKCKGITMSPSLRIKRFVAVAICATLAIAGMFYVEFFVFPDLTPPTPFEKCWFYVWAVASWPLSVVWIMSKQDPPFIVMILLTIASGLFWGLIVELFIRVRRRESWLRVSPEIPSKSH